MRKVTQFIVHRSLARQRTAWVMLAVGMVVPGALLAVDPNHWTTTLVLNQSLHMSPLVVAFVGGVTCICGILTLFMDKARDWLYFVGAGAYGLVGLANTIALFQGTPVGAFFVGSIILTWMYIEGSAQGSELREKRLGKRE